MASVHRTAWRRLRRGGTVTSTHIDRLPQQPACLPKIPIPFNASPWFGRIVPGDDTASRLVSHNSNIEYVRWLDQIGQRHLEDLGWSADTLVNAGAMWFVARHEIDYRREAYAGETLFVATWVRSIRRVKSWRDTVIWRPEPPGEIVCTASTLWVHVDLGTRRPTHPPEDMAKALSPIDVSGESPWRQRT